jgi:anti-sigma factor RsiW
VNCREFQELISAAVDRYLSSDELELFLEHAKKCPPCQDEYDSEVTTKRIVQNRAKMVKTPVAVARMISDTIQRETAARSPHRRRWWQEFLQKPFVKPALVLGAGAVVVALLLVDSPDHPESLVHASLPGNDVLVQSFSNHLEVENGAIQPQLVSAEPERVRSFFTGKTGFPVLVRSMRECTLVGAVLNEHSGAPLAHIVYEHADQLIYVYQACWKTVETGEQLRLPAPVKSALEHTGMYTETRPDGRTVALWTEGETLCAAVARLDRDELLSCLSVSVPSTP